MFAGLRPATRTIWSKDTLSYYDYNIIVDANVNINLPTPLLGQTYEIVVTGSCTLLQLGQNGINDNLTGIIHAPRLDKWSKTGINLTVGFWKVICGKDKNGNLRWWVN
jgi:hypothetical protein